jgi:hypothetical protein
MGGEEPLAWRRDWAARCWGCRGHRQPGSVSHSRGYAAWPSHPAQVAVGVDLQCGTARVPRDGGRRLLAVEYELLASLGDPQELCATFYELWTLKEAFAKALRLPLVDALRRCRFVDAEFDHRADIPTTRHWRATVFAPRPQLRLAVARVADGAEHLDVPLGKFEWPRPRTSDWTVIRSLSSGGD